MRPLSHREKRTVRLGALAIAIYLALFCGIKGWTYFARKHADFQRLVQEARTLKDQVRVYEDKILVVRKLMETFQLDPARLTKATVVAEASAAIQKAALSGRVMMGPIRESPPRPSGQELGSLQMEGFGPAPAVVALLHRIQSVGYPVVVDSVQLSSEPTKPGQVKVSLTILILDFEQWNKEVPRA